MKKALVFIAAFSVALCVFGVSYTPVTEEATADITGALVASGSGYIAATPQVSALTNVVTTTFTPQYAGQLLIGTISNVVYVAEDLTTNGWIQVSE